MGVETREGTFNSAGGPQLYRRSWSPGGEPRAAVAIVHGYAEHCGRYQWPAEQLAGAGFAVHAYDLRGHGQSEGPRVFVKSFREHLDDLDAFLALVRAENDDRPVFLLGHSMGGMIVTLYCAIRHREMAGLITSGAAVSRPGGVLRAMAGVMGLVARVRPTLGVRRLAAATVSRDLAVVEAYDTDPLVFRGKMPAATIAAFGRAIARIAEDMDTISLPLLVMHGTADELAPMEGVRALYEAVASSDKTLKLYEGLAHEILNEPEKEQVMDDLRAWLMARS